ncbi:MAG: hypothetical protein KGQ40_15250, partial [Rhodospirillales bacterium]|nr:hypothetical protein [Rhodospirillales bacterium]
MAGFSGGARLSGLLALAILLAAAAPSPAELGRVERERAAQLAAQRLAEQRAAAARAAAERLAAQRIATAARLRALEGQTEAAAARVA